MKFRETLPSECPPASATDDGYPTAYRFVLSAAPAMSDFASHAAKGLLPSPSCDPCKWASCSMYASLATVQKKRKLKSLQKYPYVAVLEITKGSGKLAVQNEHIDFWMCDTFDPISAINELVTL